MNSFPTHALARELLLPCETLFVALPPPGRQSRGEGEARRQSRSASARFGVHPTRQIPAQRVRNLGMTRVFSKPSLYFAILNSLRSPMQSCRAARLKFIAASVLLAPAGFAHARAADVDVSKLPPPAARAVDLVADRRDWWSFKPLVRSDVPGGRAQFSV